MKVLRSIVEFFTDDLQSAGMVIVWTLALWLFAKFLQLGSIAAPIYFAGILGILGYSTWKRSKK